MKKRIRLNYEKPQTIVILFESKAQLLESSLPLDPETTLWQW